MYPENHALGAWFQKAYSYAQKNSFANVCKTVWQQSTKKAKEFLMTTHTIAHTTWNCKYHVVFAPKYRRKAFYGGRRLEIGAILRELCRWKGIGIIEAEVCPDHIHMLLEIPPKYSVSSIMGYLKGKSSLSIYERWGNAKFRYRNREFWCKGYYVDTTGKNTQKIAEYIRNQLKEDAEQSQLTMDFDPFTGSK